MIQDIPIETRIANGIVFNHEDNEETITKKIWMNIPSDATMEINDFNDNIVTLFFDNIIMTLYPHANPRINVYRNKCYENGE